MRLVAFACLTAIAVSGCWGLEREGTVFKVFQFPADGIPRIDGELSDWDRVPESYAVKTDELWEDSGKHEKVDTENLEVSVKVGWVAGMNRLYFLYEAHDDYWDFALSGLKNDTFEVVVDADLSGGPLIDRFRENSETVEVGDAWMRMHGVHAQNYHIFTPAREKDWTMLWGPAQWLKELPYANFAYNYDFEPGESGKLTLEFWITPFDYASADGPEHSVISQLSEGDRIGLSWAIIDYDDVESDANNGFWNLSRSHTMYGKASELVAFSLMPLEEEWLPPIKADWRHSIVDRSERIVAFFDDSVGDIVEWEWDFGDGQRSSERNPVHRYAETGHFVVTLTVRDGKEASRLAKVWDVSFK